MMCLFQFSTLSSVKDAVPNLSWVSATNVNGALPTTCVKNVFGEGVSPVTIATTTK